MVEAELQDTDASTSEPKQANGGVVDADEVKRKTARSWLRSLTNRGPAVRLDRQTNAVQFYMAKGE